MSRLNPGDLCCDRFRIEHVAGVGGMGTVYRACDTRTGETVALKVLHREALSPGEAARFHREAKILAGLRHPGIARYIDHGALQDGQAYLAMEWLEGETLAQRLLQTGLSLHESLRCLRAAAASLAVAHGQGVVHRDVKPSNLFLRGGDVDRVVVLDFGIARGKRVSYAVTHSGTVIGTPEYMAPEQARGQGKLRPAADVFSLGSLWFECLTGTPPFVGEHVAAVLAKVLFEPVPDVRTLRPELPEAVASLLGTMLNRSEAERPADAQALLGQLDRILRSGLADVPPPPRSSARERPRPSPAPGDAGIAPGNNEQELISVLLCRMPAETEDPQAGMSESRAAIARGLDTLLARLSSLGMQVVPLLDGSLVLSFLGSWGSATDQVGQAARCALLIRDHLPGSRMAIATGRGALIQQVPMGEALGRAASLLADPQVPADQPVILLDRVTAGLLDSRFLVRRCTAGHLCLDQAALDADTMRLLLGRPTPCVGREHELTALDSLLNGVMEEHSPRAMVITAAAGIGKSRLRHEFLHRVSHRDESVQVLFGRCDPLRMNVPLGVFADLLRRHLGLRGDEDPARARALLSERLSSLPGPVAGLECELLGDLLGLQFPDTDLPLLAAARHDGQLFRSLVQRAVLGWLRRTCAVAPVLLVLEDLHWSDMLTVSVLDDVLRSLSDAPLAVLAMARPEVLERFPKLWSAQAQIIPLRPLNRRACERLIVQVLESRCTPELVAELVDLAEGNAFVLEELIRHTAERTEGQRPETFLALLQNRISRLDAPSRRILRLASIFGESFTLAGVTALVDGKLSPSEIASWLAVLCRAELIQERNLRSTYLAGNPRADGEYRFRHALLRDAAYSLLTTEEEQGGHRLAALFLEADGTVAASVVAEHMLRSGDPSRALPYLMRAASSSWAQASPYESLRLIDKALAVGAAGTLRGECLAMQGAARVYVEDNAGALASAREARQYLEPGSRYWYLSLNTCVVVAGLTGDIGTLIESIQRFESVEPTREVAVGFGEAAGVVGSMYATLAQRQPLQRLVDRCRAFVLTHGREALPYRALAPMQIPAYFLHRMFLPLPFTALAEMAQALTDVERQGELDLPPIFVGLYARALIDVGRSDGAHELIDRLSVAARTQRDPWGETLVAFYALSTSTWPRDQAGLARLEGWSTVVRDNPKAPMLFKASALASMGYVHLCRGDLAQAESLAQASLQQLEMLPTRSAGARIVLSQVRLAQGDAASALQIVDEAMSQLISVGALAADELPLHLCRLRALRALGRQDELQRGAQAASEALELRRADAPDVAAWQQYLSVPSHAELVALCRDVLSHEPQSSAALVR